MKRLGSGRLVAVIAVIAVIAVGGGVLALSLTRTTEVPPKPRPVTTLAPLSPAPGRSVTVSSVADLLTALADDAITDITVADGTYTVSPASDQAPDSLWIGAQFAARTHPVIVRAATPGGVTLDGGGTTYFGCISFEAGAHDQTWDGFRCANGQATDTGVVTFGGIGGDGYEAPGPERITLRRFTIDRSCTGRATAKDGNTTDHAIYISQALGTGPSGLVLEDITVDGRGGLASAVQFFHSDAAHPNAHDVTIRRLTVTGTQQALILWDGTLRNITVDYADISGALNTAVRYEAAGASGITLANIWSTGSGSGSGWVSSLGAQPSGVVLDNNSFH